MVQLLENNDPYKYTGTRVNYLWLRMAGIEIDCNLKKLANFFFHVLLACALWRNRLKKTDST